VLPVVEWLPRYERRWLRGDLLAGVAVTALVVPKNLGYAGIAGVPLENGLYAAAAGAIIYALFCTSRQISTGPSSSLAAVAGGAVLVTKLAGHEAAQLVAAITLVTGVLFLLLALLRMGWIAQFLSKAVITGFLAGAAVDVTIGELPKLTGTSSSGDSAWRELATWIQALDEIHWTTLLVGLVALGVILGLRFATPAVPGALVLVVGGLIASGLFDLGAHGVALVGDVLRLDSGVFFATAEALDDRIRALIRDGEPRVYALVLDLEGVDFIDSQGAAKLAELNEVAEAEGVTLRLAHLKPQVLAVLDADGFVATLGADRVHGNVDQAIEAQLAEDIRHGVPALSHA
jgi:anti-anti-sigma factor